MIGSTLVFATTLLFMGHRRTADLLDTGLAFMVGVSIWDFASPENRRCGPGACELPVARGR